MHNKLHALQPYPFQKLANLFSDIELSPTLEHIPLSIGEPRHKPPSFVLDTLKTNLDSIIQYPLTKGSVELREAITRWVDHRFHAKISSDQQVIPVNGTREALFAFSQCIVNSNNNPVVIMPNPFYQIYEGAAILSGAEAYFANTTADNGFLPDLDTIPESIWKKCQLFYACSPGNPTGAVFPQSLWLRLIEYADKYNFTIAADECYSEVYMDEDNPPTGLLQTCVQAGRDDFSRCVVFHSLSKRSNLPGLRSGFVAGDAHILRQFLLYRTYHGCAMSLPTQIASAAAWNDESHVIQNRNLYREKYAAVMPILSPWMKVKQPEASFYLWPEIPGGDEESFSRGLFQQQSISVLPGSYLSRNTDNGNPGTAHVRIALVANIEKCIEAAERIARFCGQLPG